jgi:hypothetical protein
MLIHICTHDFEKQNTVTIIRGKKCYDKVKCKYCGLEGIRYGLSEFISVKYNKKCTRPVSKKIKVISAYVCNAFEFSMNKIYEIIECPVEHSQYKKDVWIYSDERKEPVRLLPGEFIYVE